MNDADKKPKFIKFADGRHGQELEVLADELSKYMPKEVRGKLAPSVLWMARHFKSLHDDNRVNLERVSELECRVSELTNERDTQKVNLEDLRKKNIQLTEDNIRLKQNVSVQQAPVPPRRTLDQARQLIREKRCPVCGDNLHEYTSQQGRSYVSCQTCNFYLNGTAENPQIERQRR